ncbi:Putative ribonuclease H protein At1g65750 [Linum grandiflorum]
MHFIWITYHNRLMTNVERYRRHISTTAKCPLCDQAEETATHILRNCSIARCIWNQVLGSQLTFYFCQQPLDVWMLHGVSNDNYKLEFGIICWLLWKHRNEFVFRHATISCDQLRLRVLNWIAGVWETMKAEDRVSSGNKPPRVESLVRWTVRSDIDITVNTNGSVIQSSGIAAGGVDNPLFWAVFHTFHTPFPCV